MGQITHTQKVGHSRHFYTGSPLILSTAETLDGPRIDHSLGPDLLAGQSPQIIVPAQHWQAARPTGAYALVGCTVSPGFQFSGFTLAPPDTEIS